jgi:hypothetical protein
MLPPHNSQDNAVTAASGKSSTFKLTWACLMIFAGTCTTLFSKAMYETPADGLAYCNTNDDDDKHCNFEKPWYIGLLMKFAMTTSLPLYYWFGWGKEHPNEPSPSWATIKGTIFPAGLDLLATVLGNVGLLYLNSSIYQMTRGSVVIFSAILTVKYLGRVLRSFQYWAIGFVVLAVILVGTAGIEESPSDSGGGEVALGLFLIFLMEAIIALQIIIEETIMNDAEFPLNAVALCGFEGVWGLVMYAFLVPILTLTPPSSAAISVCWHEDFSDTFTQLGNSSTLLLLSLGYFLADLLFNIAANYVTQYLSTVVRSILEACRVIGVWVVGLVLFYCGSGGVKDIGESWSNWSFLELAGFGLLLYGTFAYKALVKIPWVDEEEYLLALQDANEVVAVTKEKDVAEAGKNVKKEQNDIRYPLLPEDNGNTKSSSWKWR